jgi:hypothetical protein
MSKLPFILFGAMAAVVSIGVGQGCGDGTANTGGSGPGGGNNGGATTQGNGGTSPGTGGTSSTTTPTGSGGTSPGTGGSGTGGGSACSGSTPVELTVINADVWCNVTVNHGTASSAGTQTVCVAANATVDLAAAPISNTFALADDMWHHVDDSTGNTGVKGDQTSMPGTSLETKTVPATGKACVWVCCPGANPPAFACPTADQCP